LARPTRTAVLIVGVRHSEYLANAQPSVTIPNWNRTVQTVEWRYRVVSSMPTDVLARVRGAAPEAASQVGEVGLDCAVLALDRQGRVTSWSPRAERILGVNAGDLLGRHGLSVLARHGPAGAKPDRTLEMAAATGRYQAQGWRWRMDGSRFWASTTVSALVDQVGGRVGFVAIVRDMTESKRRADELRVALEVSRAILGGQAQGAVLQLVAQRARALLEGDCAFVSTPGASGDVLVLRAAAWRHPRDAVRVSAARELPRRASIAGRVFDSGRPRLVVDLPATTATSPRSTLVGRAVGGPALFVPLAAASRKLGTLTVQNWKSRRPFHRQDLQVLQLFASRAALAIHHARVSRDRDNLAVAEERERLGRELHDGAIQSLYAVTLSLSKVVTGTSDHGLHEQLLGLATRVDGVIEGLRHHIHQLRRDTPTTPLDA
jgi:PAS domain S-box-containing protein